MESFRSFLGFGNKNEGDRKDEHLRNEQSFGQADHDGVDLNKQILALEEKLREARDNDPDSAAALDLQIDDLKVELAKKNLQ